MCLMPAQCPRMDKSDLCVFCRKAKKEIETLDKVLSTLGNAAGNSHVRNRLVAVQCQRENKVNLSEILSIKKKNVYMQCKIKSKEKLLFLLVAVKSVENFVHKTESFADKDKWILRDST